MTSFGSKLVPSRISEQMTSGTTLYSTQFEAVNSFLDNRECEAVQPLWDILSVLQKVRTFVTV